ncbi:MAG: COR domain-containing protein, partial [Blastocatellia bacterium]
LHNNPDLKIPPEVLEEGAKSVLAFIKEGPQPHWMSKLMLVGEGRHGKSSLLRALLDKEFDPNLPTTHGMLVGRLPLPHPRRDGIEMELSTWDFGGQQIYQTMHQFFLTDRSLYVLVWDGQRRWEECKIEAWLESLALRAPNAPVILVATHCPKGGRPADPPFAQLTETFPNLIPIHFEVDNQTGDGIAELRAQLIETAANLPLMGELSPPAWTAVKEALRTRRQTEKACTVAALEDVMSAHGIAAPASQKRLTRFLNELGEIIHYPDNPALHDTVLLDPEWVSQTISLVMDNEEVQRGLGYFRRETMDKIWRHLGVGMPDRMLSLMEEFDLSYRTLDDREISIVVERLQQDPPGDWDKEWNSLPVPFQEITMEFKLETELPPGIPSWFIARQHQYTRNTHWRRGAVFADDRQHPRHWALIEAYPEKSLVRLTVRGPVPHDFFSRMRRGLWETFNRYEGLREGKFRVVETVPCPGQLEDAPCTYEHELTDLERKLERGKNTMTCNRCDEEIAVPELLLGIRFEPTYEKLEAIHADVIHTRERVDEIHSLVSTLQGGHAELFNAFQHIEEMQSPYVFVLRTGAYDSDLTGLFHGTGIRGNAFGELRHRLWKQKMELQLYCQHPGEWHPLGYDRGKDDPATGLYQVEVNGELLMLLAPYLPKLAKLLKYAKPFAQAAKAMAGLPPVAPEVEGLKNIIDSDHGMMERLVKNLPSPEDMAKQVSSLEGSAEAKMMRGLGDAANPTEARGALLRQLRRLLLDKDKDQIWGGLQRKYVKAEGHHLWLCPHHLAEYKI